MVYYVLLFHFKRGNKLIRIQGTSFRFSECFGFRMFDSSVLDYATSHAHSVQFGTVPTNKLLGIFCNRACPGHEKTYFLSHNFIILKTRFTIKYLINSIHDSCIPQFMQSNGLLTLNQYENWQLKDVKTSFTEPRISSYQFGSIDFALTADLYLPGECILAGESKLL